MPEREVSPEDQVKLAATQEVALLGSFMLTFSYSLDLMSSFWLPQKLEALVTPHTLHDNALLLVVSQGIDNR